MIRTGKIVYPLWTITGTIDLKINYSLEIGDDGIPRMGDLTVDGQEQEDAPEIQQDDLESIIDACIEDAKKERPEGLGDYTFSLN